MIDTLIPIEMASRQVGGDDNWTAFDQLNDIIDVRLANVEQFELQRGRRTSLSSLYEALDHQLQECLLDDRGYQHQRYIVPKLWDLKLQIHMQEKEDARLSDVIGHIVSLLLDLYLENVISKSIFIYVCTHLYTLQ